MRRLRLILCLSGIMISLRLRCKFIFTCRICFSDLKHNESVKQKTISMQPITPFRFLGLIHTKHAWRTKMWYLLGLLFNPEYEGSTFLWNISKLLPDYMASHPRREYPSKPKGIMPFTPILFTQNSLFTSLQRMLMKILTCN
jgi:hypothetical protein